VQLPVQVALPRRSLPVVEAEVEAAQAVVEAEALAAVAEALAAVAEALAEEEVAAALGHHRTHGPRSLRSRDPDPAVGRPGIHCRSGRGRAVQFDREAPPAGLPRLSASRCRRCPERLAPP
jgi:hypothetical protein